MAEPAPECTRCGSPLSAHPTSLTIDSGSLRASFPSFQLCRSCEDSFTLWMARHQGRRALRTGGGGGTAGGGSASTSRPRSPRQEKAARREAVAKKRKYFFYAGLLACLAIVLGVAVILIYREMRET